ncbi:MAG: hypothetical protein SNH01_03230 [Rikenellaceae bacterium]
MKKLFSLQGIATFILVLMCIQYVPIEGSLISPLKVGVMALTPALWLIATPKFTRAVAFGVLYLMVVFFAGMFNPDSFRASTVIYLSLFVVMFMVYYNLIYCEKVFKIDYFIKVIQWLILAFFIFLVLQQISRLAGINYFPLINLHGGDHRGILIGRSLSVEQSYTGRVVPALFLCLIRMYEVKWGEKNITIKRIYNENKLVVWGFLWTMITMGSGTAFVSLGVLSLYFIKRQYIMSAVPLLVMLYIAIPYIDYTPLNRAKATFDASLTLDREDIIEADGSGASRITPMLNTLQLDFTAKETWFGRGIDTGRIGGLMNSNETVGGISDYGFLAYLFSLLLVFQCMIRKFFSIETIFFFVLLVAGLYNVAFYWGILLLFTTSFYFQMQKREDPSLQQPVD